MSAPAVVVTVPVSSAFHRLSRQSTEVMVPTGSSVRVADRQTAGSPAAAELGPMVLDAAVLDGETDLVGARLLVHHAAE